MTTYHLGETYLRMQLIDSGFYPRKRLNDRMSWVKEESHHGGSTYILNFMVTQSGYALKKITEIKDGKRSKLEMAIISEKGSVAVESVKNCTEEIFYRGY